VSGLFVGADMYKKIQAFIDATNCNNDLIFEKLCGREIIAYSCVALDALQIPCAIISHDPHIVSFEGKSVSSMSDVIAFGSCEHVLVVNGAMPLVKPEAIEQLCQSHINSSVALSYVACVEGADCASSLYLIKKTFFDEYCRWLQDCNAFDFKTLLNYAQTADWDVFVAQQSSELMMINHQSELSVFEQCLRTVLIQRWMLQGIRFFMPETVHLDSDVIIGAGSYIGAHVKIRSGTVIGQHCAIEDFTIIENSSVADRVTIYPYSLIKDSTIECDVSVGPFAHIRANSVLESQSSIGNFVEVKKSMVGAGSKAKHLSYLGDAVLGERVNIGAGTITCNYDGVSKKPTIIQDNAYIGSNNSLVAPIVIGKGAYTAAGSTVTENVPDGALAIGRAKQCNKEGYAQKLREKFLNSASGKAKEHKTSAI
jgi:bifunctional N-acetylglucosamine-1-phosphate-uridyltransferase/glucosamine-1-phosphate-acetyltransferase GlmU-like protein